MPDEQTLADMPKHKTSLRLHFLSRAYIHHNYPLRKEATEILYFLAAKFDSFTLSDTPYIVKRRSNDHKKSILRF